MSTVLFIVILVHYTIGNSLHRRAHFDDQKACANELHAEHRTLGGRARVQLERLEAAELVETEQTFERSKHSFNRHTVVYYTYSTLRDSNVQYSTLTVSELDF